MGTLAKLFAGKARCMSFSTLSTGLTMGTISPTMRVCEASVFQYPIHGSDHGNAEIAALGAAVETTFQYPIHGSDHGNVRWAGIW